MHLLSIASRMLAVGAALALSTAAQAFDITTYHYDAQRTGLNNSETTLTQATVSSAAFHRLQAVSLPTQVDAQPLVMSAATLAAWGYASTFPHDVVYVADEANNVFAIDSATGAVLLQKNYGTPVSIQNLPGQCGNNASTVGINSTPVIDQANKVMYFITYTWENSAAVYRIHEISLQTLAETIPSVVIKASGTLSDGSTYSLIPGTQRQRPALLLANSTVYAGFGSFCDANDAATRGWLLGWQAGSLTPLASAQLNQQQTAAQSTNNPFGESGPFFLSSVWMSGFGPAADSSGNIYFVTGNSDGILANNLPDSLVRMPANLSSVTDYFTPANFAALDSVDEDRGSGGVMVVPPVSGGPQFAVSQGKDGRLFLHNLAANLGGFVANGPDVPSSVNAGMCWCGPAYYVGSDGKQRVVSTGGTQAQTWFVPASATGTLAAEASSPELPSLDGQDPGFMATVSSNGTAAGSAVIWALSRSSNGLIFLQALSGSAGGGASTVYDKAGNAWSFGSAMAGGGTQILINGAPAFGAYGYDIVIDSTGTMWHMNSANNWWSYNGAGGWTGQTTQPTLATPTPAGVSLTTTSGGTITDGGGNSWSFGQQASGTNADVVLNGVQVPGAYGVSMTIDNSGSMWHINSLGAWYRWTGNGWSSQPAGPNFAVPSAAGSFITPSSGGLVTDKAGRFWQFGPANASSPSNYEVLVDGSPAYGAYGVKIVIDTSGTMWHTNSAGGWWYYNGSGGWVGGTGPTLPTTSAPGATVSAAGRLPRLRIIQAGQWAYPEGNANLVPVVANGKVYVASYGQLQVWGLQN